VFFTERKEPVSYKIDKLRKHVESPVVKILVIFFDVSNSKLQTFGQVDVESHSWNHKGGEPKNKHQVDDRVNVGIPLLKNGLENLVSFLLDQVLEKMQVAGRPCVVDSH